MIFTTIMIFITLYLSALAIWIQTRQIKRLNKRVDDLNLELIKQIGEAKIVLLKKIYSESIDTYKRISHILLETTEEETDVQQEEAE